VTRIELIKLGMIENARRGNFNGGVAPFGYYLVLNEYNRQQLVIDEKEAEAVMIIFKRAARGEEPYFISYELKQRGFTTKTGKDFDARALRRILASEKYIGVYTYGDVRIYDGCPAIVPVQLFQAVCKTKRYRNDKAQLNYGGCDSG
jgi:hypothetical protein